MKRALSSIATTIVLLLCSSASLFANDYRAGFLGINDNSTMINTQAIQFAIDYKSEHGGADWFFPLIYIQRAAYILSKMLPFSYMKAQRSLVLLTLLTMSGKVCHSTTVGKPAWRLS